jgi:serine/threonine protein kinase
MPYCPPETFNRLKKFTSKSDVFSLGIMLYRTLFTDFPFTASADLKESFIEKTYL